ncbi:hypothetical protein CAI21_15415 [Alkalilimnicola ehrlichii]|uniref:AB hydrolase-1 domain-containing protein n=1 Tax=Alkalilimnicola ehrlichii TaxID=351052 RepID=A0A3E0WRE1_9GAMM|nr:alpha/beta hydrolase [Alkalilimnicola ehrlichii]RFA27232.1 hypothetical protein CAI21_15415 [Alkalilimnicola ehrlichii]RFA35408.1 hypothetical protein CAL65_13090 [Alkalilimnicola ehrlichii]
MPVFNDGKQDIYYELYGAAGTPVVSLVNGLSMRTSHWAPYFDLLPKLGCRVLTYDLLGQGQSSKPVLGVSFEEHAVHLAALHEHLGIEKPYVMGISFGGVVVLKYASLFPERIGGLLPVSTFSELDEQLRCHAHNLYKAITRVGFEFYLELLMPLNFTNRFLAGNRALTEVIKRVGVNSNELYGIQNLMESLAHFESMTGELGDIHCPTLIMNAEYDALTPRHLHDLLRRKIENSRLVLVPHMAHAFTLEVPDLTARLIAMFVEQVESGQWRGDQTVWQVDDDFQAEPLLHPCQGNHLRFLPPLAAS